jgi:DNA topoisomerase-3
LNAQLVIAEKPSVGMSLAAFLGAKDRKDGYIKGNGYIVSWCVGHLAGFADAYDYDEKYGKWRHEDLPIIPEDWKYTIFKGKDKQFKILRNCSGLLCENEL